MEQEIFPPPLESCNSDNKTNNNPRDIAIVLSKVSTKKRSHKRKENSTAPQLLYNKLLKELYEPGITPKTILSNGEHADVFAIKYLIKTTEDYKRRFKKCKRKKEENLTQEQKKQKKEDV